MLREAGVGVRMSTERLVARPQRLSSESLRCGCLSRLEKGVRRATTSAGRGERGAIAKYVTMRVEQGTLLVPARTTNQERRDVPHVVTLQFQRFPRSNPAKQSLCRGGGGGR